MNFGFSGEMIFLFLLALILFGPKKMPEIGRQVARILNEFRRASNEFRSQIESEVNSLDMTGKNGTNSRSTSLPSFQAPLGSLANRIFNPPSAEKPAPAANSAAEVAPSAAVATPASAEPASTVETIAAPAPAHKVAPDA